MMGLDAFDHGYVSNESGGSIEMYGRGNVGMLAIDESTAENAGQITLDALWVDADDTTTLRSNIGNDAELWRWYGRRYKYLQWAKKMLRPLINRVV